MMDAEARRVAREAGDAWVKESRKLAPQRPPPVGGTLRKSIRMRPSRTIVEVVAEAPYASYVEFGTRHMAAQPFFLPGRRAGDDVFRRAKLRP
jgi:HK97 gp10 family phage protein